MGAKIVGRKRRGADFLIFSKGGRAGWNFFTRLSGGETPKWLTSFEFWEGQFFFSFLRNWGAVFLWALGINFFSRPLGGQTIFLRMGK